MDGGDKSYETLAYPDFFFRFTHPDLLATMATLYGLQPPDVTRARVLELGCASGSNIIPMAEQLPQGSFVGIDASPTQIERGRKVMGELGLTNIRLDVQDLMRITPDFGQFDYIIAHGLYSWVPPEVGDRVLQICHDNLAPDGIAYVSFNTFPGWHLRGMFRDLLLYATRNVAGPAECAVAARKCLTSYLRTIEPRKDPLAELLRGDIARLLQKDNAALFHDHMEEHNHPVYFHEFVARAGTHALQHVADADAIFMLGNDVEPSGLAALAPSGDPIEREQFLDFARCQSFRRAILCHDKLTVERQFRLGPIRRLRVASIMRPKAPRNDARDATEIFQGHGSFGVETADPLIRHVLHEAVARCPERIEFNQLVERAIEAVGLNATNRTAFETTLAQLILRGYAQRSFDLATRPADFRLRPTDHPTARQFARLQAAHTDNVVNFRHEGVRLEPQRRQLLQLLDGTRTIAQLTAAMTGAVPATEAATWVKTSLLRFAVEALLVA